LITTYNTTTKRVCQEESKKIAFSAETLRVSSAASNCHKSFTKKPVNL